MFSLIRLRYTNRMYFMKVKYYRKETSPTGRVVSVRWWGILRKKTLRFSLNAHTLILR